MEIQNKFLSEQEYLAQMKSGALLNPRIDSTMEAGLMNAKKAFM